MSHTIVVGVDGSSASRAAIRWAVERADSTGSDIELLHVVDDEWGTVGSRLIEEMHPSARDLIEREINFAQAVEPTMIVTGRLLHGDPMVELEAASLGTSMIVLGTHKTGFIHGQAFGSRSLQLAAMARVPVAVIPESSTRLRRGIVVGVDDSEAGHAAIAFGAAEANRTGQQLTLLHAVRAALPFEQQELESNALELAKANGAPHPIRTRTVRRPAAEALVDASAVCALLVIGSSRRRAMNIAALGPVSHDVLLNLAGPVLVVHGDFAAQMTPLLTNHRTTA
ncbi:universal stress protein [Glaciihabitans sp. UYNi722]|uniref:universal stress protein n=1 Tax=Glaciihabitans sp. UYNi722 TaxID=3156344 RepID=UPI0033946B10